MRDKNHPKPWLIFLVLLMPFGHLQAQDSTAQAQVLTLKQCLNMGISNSHSLKKSKLEEEAARYQRKEITGSGLPQVSAEGKFNDNLSIPTQLIPGDFFGAPGQYVPIQFGFQFNTNAAVSVNQLVFSESYLVGLKAARTSVEFYRLLSQQSEENVIYDISRNFYAIEQLNLQLKTLNTNKERLEKLKGILKAQYENDVARKVDYSRVQVNLSNLDTQMDDLKTQLARQKNYLKLLMGVPLSTNFETDTTGLSEATKQVDMSIFDTHTSPDFSNLSQIQVLQQQKVLRDLEAKNAYSKYYPSLNAFGNLNFNSYHKDFTVVDGPFYRGMLIGLSLHIPIFDGGQAAFSAKQSKIKMDEIDQDIAMSTTSAQMDYENAKSQLQNSLHAVGVQKDNLDLAKEVYTQTEASYREGLSPLTDLLDSEVSLREAKSNYFNQLIKVKTAQIDLLKAKGQIKTLLQ